VRKRPSGIRRAIARLVPSLPAPALLGASRHATAGNACAPAGRAKTEPLEAAFGLRPAASARKIRHDRFGNQSASFGETQKSRRDSPSIEVRFMALGAGVDF
jgi:hypothetical protein